MKTQYLEIIRFAGTSMAGVAADLLIFYFLVQLQVSVSASALLSGVFAVLVSGMLSLFLAFKVRYSNRKYFWLTGYYLLSLSIFAGCISWICDWTQLPPMIVKVSSLPISFTINYLGSRQILRNRMGK